MAGTLEQRKKKYSNVRYVIPHCSANLCRMYSPRRVCVYCYLTHIQISLLVSMDLPQYNIPISLSLRNVDGISFEQFSIEFAIGFVLLQNKYPTTKN